MVSPVDPSTVPQRMPYAWETTILIDAWSRDNHAIRGNYPYVTRKSVRSSIEANKPEWSKRTTDTKMGLFKKLTSLGILEQIDQGWIVIDGMLNSQLFVSKGIDTQ